MLSFNTVWKIMIIIVEICYGNLICVSIFGSVVIFAFIWCLVLNWQLLIRTIKTGTLFCAFCITMKMQNLVCSTQKSEHVSVILISIDYDIYCRRLNVLKFWTIQTTRTSLKCNKSIYIEIKFIMWFKNQVLHFIWSFRI